MIPLEYEIDHLKDIFFEMVDLVRDQLTLTKEAIMTNDSDVASEVMRKEGRVNSYELSIDRECEDFMALQAPVATDLRMVIAILKMSGSLERIGDHAYRISSFIYDDKLVVKKNLIKILHLTELFDTIDKMLENVIQALDTADTKIAKTVFKQDKVLDRINKNVPEIMEDYIKSSKDTLPNIILASRTIGKLERIGDLIKNIAEEVIFYYESKVVKHQRRNKKIKKMFNKNYSGKE
ncbi:MAG: phosphate signaling complex protein PhoU [Bacteroidales bacterium]|nr:phosphate signaling complex protein PhoU [Bacteroidales bacterium]